MDNYIKALIHRMARINNLTLTDEHRAILEYAESYYAKNRVGPLYQNIKKNTGLGKEDIERLFPHGLNSVYTWVDIPIQSVDKICKPTALVEVQNRRQVYLDHNATTYPRRKVITALADYYSGSDFGNPSSSTEMGKRAHDMIQTAREQVAECLRVSPSEIVFTSGGSESNNMAIKGLAFRHLDRAGHIITSQIEHSSVLETCRFLETIGFRVTYLPPAPDGRIMPEQVSAALCEDTILVAIMAVNNEIGVINPVAGIGAVCKTAGVSFMSDAVQAFGKVPVRPRESGVSLMSISGHKIYAPKGVGALYIAGSLPLVPLIHGGEQEFGLRSGTENVGAIAAFGRAAKLVYGEMHLESQRLLELRDYFLQRLGKIEPDFIVNGSLEHRVPNNLNIGFPGIDSGALLLSLNRIGVYVSAGSACSSGTPEASHVIRALGVDTGRYGIIRFSFGLRTTIDDLDYLFTYLPDILKQLKQ